MDNTPRGRTGKHAEKNRPNNPDMLWVDAICQQALAAQMIAKLFSLAGDEKSASQWLQTYEEKKKPSGIFIGMKPTDFSTILTATATIFIKSNPSPPIGQ